jgi:hypothetical protein
VDIGRSVGQPGLPQWRHGSLSEIAAGRAPVCAPLDDLDDYLTAPAHAPRLRTKRDRTMWTVTDDWPNDVPVTEAEIDVFEAWFGNLFDDLFGDD